MLKLAQILILIGVMLGTYDKLERGRRQRGFEAQAIASRFLTIGEAAQRYATATRHLRPGVAEAVITVPELIAESYLPAGTSDLGPYGGPIELIARTGAYGHVVVDMSVYAPADVSADLRVAMSTLDRGGGQVSLQAMNGAARFTMAAAAVSNAADFVRFSGSNRAGQALGDDSAK
jgi:hypothetical protein